MGSLPKRWCGSGRIAVAAFALLLAANVGSGATLPDPPRQDGAGRAAAVRELAAARLREARAEAAREGRRLTRAEIGAAIAGAVRQPAPRLSAEARSRDLVARAANVSSAERDALIALYNATGGAAWTVRTNWRNAGDTDFNDAGTECTW